MVKTTTIISGLFLLITALQAEYSKEEATGFKKSEAVITTR